MALTLVFGAQAAVAQGDNPLPWDDLTEPVEYLFFEIPETEWTLYPVITVDSTFVGFFGYMPDDFVIGDNVSLLWLTPDNGNGTWSMYGWSHTDLKVVSQYLDQLTDTTNVLADTGLDVFAGDPQPITEPQSMPFGIAEDDPAAPIMEATQDPLIADALIDIGAAGAPDLSSAITIEPIDDCDPEGGLGLQITLLDKTLAFYARTVQESMNIWLSSSILTSLELTGMDKHTEVLRACFPCLPSIVIACNGWSPWSCTGGPTAVGGQCNYTGCTRSRNCIIRTTTINCTIITLPFSMTQGPRPITAPPLPGGGGCPPNP